MTPAANNSSPLDRSFPAPSRGAAWISAELRLDILYCTLLLVLTAIMVLPGSLTLPMELWDESRTANNGMEMAQHGGWMVPTFGGVPDHWNTKPPLLIWIIAALLRTGLDPLLAVRLPSVLATMGSVLLVYLTCRSTIQDRMTGLLAGLLTLCSVLFLGDHVGRTGDYDALLSLLCLGSVVCIGHYIDATTDRSGAWIAAGSALLLLALLAKGVAASLPLPGLFAYAITRGRFLAILRDWRIWVSVFGVLGGAASLLMYRENLDPGYLAAVWNNDVSGRLLTALDQHAEDPWFYLVVLATTFQPAILLLPTLLCMRRDPDPARRRLCLLMLLTACSWLIALSCANTKIYWYVAPVVPLLAIAIAIGTTTYLRSREQSTWVVLRPAILAMLIAFWYLNIRAPAADTPYAADQVQYGAFLNDIRGDIPLAGAVILDRGLPNDAGFQYYNPVARFYAGDAARRGVRIDIATPGARIAGDTTIISCDPLVRNWLKVQPFFIMVQGNTHCVLGRASSGSDDLTHKPTE
jgi:4-amino-4-deoxy-L-arabinose transferase-like glycosyltransferase